MRSFKRKFWTAEGCKVVVGFGDRRFRGRTLLGTWGQGLTPRRRKARSWTGVDCVRTSAGAVPVGLDAVAGEGGQVGEQCAEAVDGQAVGRALAAVRLGAGGGRRSGGRDGRGPCAGGGLRVVVVEEHRGERAAHVPLDVVGEHAQEDVGAHAAGQPVVDGPHLEVDGLEAAKRAFDSAQALVRRARRPPRSDPASPRWCAARTYRPSSAASRAMAAAARACENASSVTRTTKRLPTLCERSARSARTAIRASPRNGRRSRRTASATCSSFASVAARRSARLRARSRGQQRVPAHDQPLARIQRRRLDLGQVALVEQRRLKTALDRQLLDLRRPQRRDPVQPAGSTSSRMRALVSRPRSPTTATFDSPKRSHSVFSGPPSVPGPAVFPSNTSTATGQPSPAHSNANMICNEPRLPSRECPRRASGQCRPSKYVEVTSHSAREPSLRRPAVQPPIEAQLARRADDGGDVAVRARAHDAKRVVERRQRDAALEQDAKALDQLVRPLRQVRQRFLAHLAAFSVGATQQHGGRRVAVGHPFDVHGYERNRNPLLAAELACARRGGHRPRGGESTACTCCATSAAC